MCGVLLVCRCAQNVTSAAAISPLPPTYTPPSFVTPIVRQVLPPLIDFVPEARLHLVIYYLRHHRSSPPSFVRCSRRSSTSCPKPASTWSSTTCATRCGGGVARADSPPRLFQGAGVRGQGSCQGWDWGCRITIMVRYFTPELTIVQPPSIVIAFFGLRASTKPSNSSKIWSPRRLR